MAEITEADQRIAAQVAERAYLRGPKVLKREIAQVLADQRAELEDAFDAAYEALLAKEGS